MSQKPSCGIELYNDWSVQLTMHEKRFNRKIEFLRNPERLGWLEVERVADAVLAHLQNPVSVLDVGTGSGIFAEAFAARGLSVTGIDVNPEMLQAASEFVPSGTFKQGLAESLPFAEASFDLVFMGLLLHETDDPLAALREAHRVGIQRLGVLEWRYEPQPIGPPLEDRLSEEQISSFAKQAQFKNLQTIRLNSLMLYLMDV